MLKTVLKTPQQNGVAERMNRTLNKREKSMRLHVGLPKMFWEDSVNTATYLINRGPSVPLGFRILEEEWQGKEVSLTHLKDSKGHKVVQSKDVTFNEDSLYGAKGASDSSNLTKPNQKNQVVLEDSLENLANDSIVVENRSDEEGSEDCASSEEGRSETLQVRRSSRDSRAPVRYSPSVNYLLLRENGEPESYSEVLSSKESVQWKKAINEEMVSLEKNQTWSLVRLPAGKKALQSKWVFRVKEEYLHDTTIGFSVSWERRKPRVQFEEKSVRIKASTETMVLEVWQFYTEGGVQKICYGPLLLLEESSNMAKIKKLKRQLSQEFEMKDLGSTKQILDMSIIEDKTNEARCQPSGEQFKLSKKQSPKKEASRRRMAKVPYASAIGSLMYAMMCTRSDRAHAVAVVSRFMSNPGREHWEVVKWLLHYLKGTSKATLCFSRKEVVLKGFSDSDYGGCLHSGKSTTGYVFTVGGTAVS
ncbi:retrovirus-related pol polyprotein from transposon TNT 1-94 [Tanacetum coccineum]